MKQEWLSGAALPTLDVINPLIDGASDWKFWQDNYRAMSDQTSCAESTYGVMEGRYGGYDGWLIVQFDGPHWLYWRCYRVVGSFSFPFELDCCYDVN